MSSPKKTIYTIGYAPHTLDSFVEILKSYQVSAIVDVRSSPYSQFKSEFNRENLKDYLKANNVAYVFLGDYLGARVENPSCYTNGKVDYKLVAESQKFKEGLERLKNGMDNFLIALMCAEKDPITCHRTILICRNLLSPQMIIKHILSNGKTEDHKDSERRLLKIFKLNQPDLFRSEQERLEEAYSRQGEKIAYEMAEPTNENKDL